MTRRKSRARRHRGGLETVPEKLLVKIIEARLAGRRARQDPEPGPTWPIDWLDWYNISRSAPDDVTKMQQLLEETIVSPPKEGTSGRWLRVPAMAAAHEIKKEWLETWPQAAQYFSQAPKNENLHKAGYGVIVCLGDKCQVCQQSKPAAREVLAFTDYAELEMRALMFGRNEGIGRLNLKKRA